MFMTAIAAAHLSPDLNGQPAGVQIHVVFRDLRTCGDISGQADTVRKAYRQHASSLAASRRGQPPIDGIAALAIEAFSCLQITLRNRNRIAAP